MLTTNQITVVGAYDPGGDFVCLDCVRQEANLVEYADVVDWLQKEHGDGLWTSIIEYDLDGMEETSMGFYCDCCGKEMIAPHCQECGRDFDDEHPCAGEDEEGNWLCAECLEELEAEDADEDEFTSDALANSEVYHNPLS